MLDKVTGKYFTYYDSGNNSTISSCRFDIRAHPPVLGLNIVAVARFHTHPFQKPDYLPSDCLEYPSGTQADNGPSRKDLRAADDYDMVVIDDNEVFNVRKGTRRRFPGYPTNGSGGCAW
jgi:hypothetical protein